MVLGRDFPDEEIVNGTDLFTLGPAKLCQKRIAIPTPQKQPKTKNMAVDSLAILLDKADPIATKLLASVLVTNWFVTAILKLPPAPNKLAALLLD